MTKQLLIKVVPETVPGGVDGLAPEYVLTDADRDEFGVDRAQSLEEIQRHYGGLVFTQAILVSDDPDRYEDIDFDLRDLVDLPAASKVVLGVVQRYTYEEARALGLRDPDFAGDVPSH